MPYRYTEAELRKRGSAFCFVPSSIPTHTEVPPHGQPVRPGGTSVFIRTANTSHKACILHSPGQSLQTRRADAQTCSQSVQTQCANGEHKACNRGEQTAWHKKTSAHDRRRSRCYGGEIYFFSSLENEYGRSSAAFPLSLLGVEVMSKRMSAPFMRSPYLKKL